MAERFRHGLSTFSVSAATAGPDPGIAPDNIVILLPFALAQRFQLPGGVETARSMAVGNAFGAAHFLAQDAVLDGDEPLTPAGCSVSDGCLLAFQREYLRLLPSDSTFWRLFDRYLLEYFESLSWERNVLLTGRGAAAVGETALEESLLHIGRRLSPLKVTAAAVSELSGNADALAPLEALVDDFHTAYQLMDDLSDLGSDLLARRPSVAAWMLAAGGGLDPRDGKVTAAMLFMSGARSGALARIAEIACSRYRSAAGQAERLGVTLLAEHLQERARRVSVLLTRATTRLSLAARCGEEPEKAEAHGAIASQHLHVFSVDGQSFVYDRRSGLFFEADAKAADVAGWLLRGGDAAELGVLRMNHGASGIDEALTELSVLAGREACDEAAPAGLCCAPSMSPIVSLALNVSDRCNLACDYCYVASRRPDGEGLMTERTAHAALDILFSESFGERDLSLVFFGGEPLLNLDLILKLAPRARERAERARRSLSMHLTTNGTLLTPSVFEELRRNGISVMISVDGGRRDHDAHRRFANGRGSYDAVADNVRAIAARSALRARATITDESAPLPEVVADLIGLGFSVVHLSPASGRSVNRALAARMSRGFEQLAHSELEAIRKGRRPCVGNFMEPLVSLELGGERLSPCGAGARYLSVAHDGRLFLCHRFAGDNAYLVGDVARGVDRPAIARLMRRFTRPASCERCWALGLCGGPCLHDVAESSPPTTVVVVGGAGLNPDDDEMCLESRDVDRRCDVTRRVFELSMWLYAALPADRRRKLAEKATSGARELARVPALP